MPSASPVVGRRSPRCALCDVEQLFAGVPFGIEVADRLRRRGFTDAQVEALRNYTESPALNTPIRSGRVSAGVQTWIDRIDSAMTELPEPIRATRAVDASRAFAQFGISHAAILGNLVGEVIEEHAYLSGCLRPDPPDEFLHDVETRQRPILEFMIPAETLAAYAEAVTAHRGEQEPIVMRGSRFLIVSEPTFVSVAAGWRARAIIEVGGDL